MKSEMSSEREKLIEIWLDSATERQYQFAFRNALLSAGYTILHDTSHTALELGKDIIALAPNGDLHAFQLKGNPGSRITIAQWQGLIRQIDTLIFQPVSHPNVKAGTPHTPFPVTNGEIHEDVYAAIAGYNAALAERSAKPLQTIARGQLLKLILDSAETVWSAEIKTQRKILNLFSAQGDDELPAEDFIGILDDVLTKRSYTPTAIPSVHLVTAILASNLVAKENYFELVKMYVLLAVAAVCYRAQWRRQRPKDKRFLDEIIFDIHAHMRGFVRDLKENFKHRPLLNKQIFSEWAYFHPRKKMISGLASAAMLDPDLNFDTETWDFLWNLVCKTEHSRFLAWEGIIPYCLAEFWALCNFQGTKEPDRRLFALTRDIINANNNEDEARQLPGPYYALGEVVRWQSRFFLQNLRSRINGDDHYRRAWFAEPLFMLLARRNYKSACQLLWPDLTRFVHVRTRLPAADDFGPMTCENAIAEDNLIDVSTQKTWLALTAEVGQERVPQIPEQLLDKQALVLLYCMFMPQRMDRDVILWLDRRFCKSWY
jgi:hypothetical protein